MIKGFNYTVYSQDPSLFIAGNIYDITSGSPVFVDQVPMTHALLGSYNGTYVFNLNTVYAVVIGVYTDGTYATPDTNYAPATTIVEPGFEGVTIVQISGLDFEMDAVQTNIETADVTETNLEVMELESNLGADTEIAEMGFETEALQTEIETTDVTETNLEVDALESNMTVP